MRWAMVMAGGVGSRLWPMSRPERPKQLLPLVGGRSLLETAVARVDGLVPMERRLVCTAEHHRGLVRRLLPGLDDEQVLGEPCGRNTANAIGLVARVLVDEDPDAALLVLTADHVIEPADLFRAGADTAFRLVEADGERVVVFAIRPTFAATGYGWVRRGDPVAGFAGAYEATAFVEKPGRAAAEDLLADERAGWNSGMFVFRAATYLDALARHLPDARAGLERIGAAWRTADRRTVLESVYPDLPNESVDYGVMEPLAREGRARITVVPLDVSWLDIGSWPSFGETLEPDAHGNRAAGGAVHLDSTDMLTVTDDPGHLVATIGCRDLIVVHTADATLVCPRDRAQDVKTIAEMAARRDGGGTG